MLLGSKARETVTLKAENLVIYTDNSISLDQLLVSFTFPFGHFQVEDKVGETYLESTCSGTFSLE